MATNRVGAVAAAVALALATEVAVVTVAPLTAEGLPDQIDPGLTVQVQATVVITGAASATSCTLKVRRGAGIAGADITPTDVVASVDGAATDRSVTITLQESAVNFNAANGAYTLTATAAGAAQTARIASIEIQPLAGGV